MEGVSMSFGKMNSFIDIIDKRVRTDEEGFKVQEDEVVASVRSYREGRHGSERWANRAAFTDATTLFRFRSIPGITVTTAMVIVCGEDRFEITSVEDVKSRGMYVEALAREVKPSGKG